MIFIILPALLILAVYPLSYAKYNWDHKNKLGAVGMILLTLISIVLPTIMLLTR